MDDKRYQINNEIDKPLSDMDVDLIDAQVNELFEKSGVDIKITQKEIHKQTASIIRKSKKQQITPNKSVPTKRLTICVAVILIIALSLAVSAKTSLIADGIKWIHNKFNLCTGVTSDNETETSDSVKKQIEDFFNNDAYKLPRNIPNAFVATNYYKNERSAECTDICFQMVGNNQNLSFIISNYSNAEAISATAPSIDAELCTQFQVENITISVFNIDKTYTAYYISGTTVYQISGNMPYDDFVDILKTIN